MPTSKVLQLIDDEIEQSFFLGLAVALQVIHAHDYLTIADDICKSLGDIDYAKFLHFLKQQGGVDYATYLWLTQK